MGEVAGATSVWGGWVGEMQWSSGLSRSWIAGIGLLGLDLHGVILRELGEEMMVRSISGSGDMGY